MLGLVIEGKSGEQYQEEPRSEGGCWPKNVCFKGNLSLLDILSLFFQGTKKQLGGQLRWFPLAGLSQASRSSTCPARSSGVRSTRHLRHGLRLFGAVFHTDRQSDQPCQELLFEQRSPRKPSNRKRRYAFSVSRGVVHPFLAWADLALLLTQHFLRVRPCIEHSKFRLFHCKQTVEVVCAKLTELMRSDFGIT